jgi:uncharacterized protein YdbL (DUF1318 family)
MDEFNETLEQIELLIGRENARKVVEFFEGMNIYFPKRIGLNELHEQIYSELRRGATYQQMAQKYGYTKSYIRKIEHKKYNERKRERERPRTRRPDAAPVAVSTPAANKNLAARAQLRPRETKPFLQGELFDE